MSEDHDMFAEARISLMNCMYSVVISFLSVHKLRE